MQAEDSWLFKPATYPVQIANCAYDCEDGEHGLVYSTGYTNCKAPLLRRHFVFVCSDSSRQVTITNGRF